MHLPREGRDPLEALDRVIASVDKTGSCVIWTGLTSAGVFCRPHSGDLMRFHRHPGIICYVDKNVRAIVFGYIVVPSTYFAVPRFTASCVRGSSGLYPIALGVPAPKMSISFVLVVSFTSG